MTYFFSPERFWVKRHPVRQSVLTFAPKLSLLRFSPQPLGTGAFEGLLERWEADMAKDVAEVLGTAIGKVAREAAKSVSSNGKPSHGNNIAERVGDAVSDRMKNVSGSKGLAAGVGIAAVAPLAAKGVGKLVRGVGGGGGDGEGPIKKAGQKFGEGAKDAATSAIPGKGGKSKGMEGVGKGRRMPIQQDIDIGAPIDMVYKHWTDYEKWPEFMHRLENVSQEDDEHIAFKTKIWGISKEFRAEIVENEPGERIKWKVTDGVTHAGVVTFHELGPRLTRVEVNLDVQPGSMIEKAARGMRHVKRAVRADLARFKAYVLMEKQEQPRGQSQSSSSSSQSQSSSSSRQTRASSGGGGRSRSSSSGARKRSSSSSGARKRSSSSSGARKRSSSGARKRTSPSSNGRSSSSRTTASSNGRSSSSRSSSNGRSRSSAKKRSTSRS
jgi:uncharacterized membrane protein